MADSASGGLIEKHPFTPYLPAGTKVVICGTFPPKRDKWAMDFFYPNYYNDMWRVFGLLFFGDKEHFFNPADKTVDKEGIKEMLFKNKIGMGETVVEAIRVKDNASDKFLEVVTPVNLPHLLNKVPNCTVLATTGEKAASIIAELTATGLPKMGESITCEITLQKGLSRSFTHCRMPSTSRAYPMKLERKAEYYGLMLRNAGVLT